MAGMNQPVQNGMTPPPVPGILYYIVVNGQETGPYDLNTLRQMMTDRGAVYFRQFSMENRNV